VMVTGGKVSGGGGALLCGRRFLKSSSGGGGGINLLDRGVPSTLAKLSGSSWGGGVFQKIRGKEKK